MIWPYYLSHHIKHDTFGVMLCIHTAAVGSCSLDPAHRRMMRCHHNNTRQFFCDDIRLGGNSVQSSAPAAFQPEMVLPNVCALGFGGPVSL